MEIVVDEEVLALPMCKTLRRVELVCDNSNTNMNIKKMDVVDPKFVCL